MRTTLTAALVGLLIGAGAAIGAPSGGLSEPNVIITGVNDDETPLSTGNGVATTGALRVVVASDNTAYSVNAIQSGAWTITTTPPANQSVNVAQISGTTTLVGNGATGAGSQRVTIASDNTSFSVGTKTNNAAAPSTNNVGAIGMIANASNPSWTEGNLVLGSVNLSGHQRQNLGQVGGTATVTGGLAGTLGVGGTQANNATISANPMLVGYEAQSGQPTAATTGNIRRGISSRDGAQYVRLGGPVPWTCNLEDTDGTLTQCQAAPGAGLRLYLTDVIIGSTTATPGKFLIRYGTGANCGTGTVSLLPGPSTLVPQWAYPGNLTPPTPIHLMTPVSTDANNAICVICVMVNKCTVQLVGYTAP